MKSVGAVSEEGFDALAWQGRSGGLAHVLDDLADELSVRVGAVGVFAVEVERGCDLKLVFSEEGAVEGSAVECHGVCI